MIFCCALILVLETAVGAFEPQSRVVGTAVSICNRGTFHTIPVITEFLNSKSSQPLSRMPKLIADAGTKCLLDAADMLTYCKRIYSYHGVIVTHIMPVPFPIKVDDSLELLSKNATMTHAFWCLSSQDYMQTANSSPIHSQTAFHAQHLPTLLDVHKKYFSERFRLLLNNTRSNISHIIQSLVNQAQRLRELARNNKDLANHLTSEILKDAHQRMVQVWSREESEWTEVERAQHADFVRQLDEDDQTSQKALLYTLQESERNIDREQDSVARLLTSLTASVQEEIRHFNVVRTNQPWELRLNSERNWTDTVSQHVTSVEQVHHVLLTYVRQASVAINNLRKLMAADLRKKDTFRSTTPGALTLEMYKPNLVRSYKQLQKSLYVAQRLLNTIKKDLLLSLTTRSELLLHRLNQTIYDSVKSTTSTTGENSTIPLDWIQTKHHAELAYIDLLISHMLQPHFVNGSFDLSEKHNMTPWISHVKVVRNSFLTSSWSQSSGSPVLISTYLILLVAVALFISAFCLVLVMWTIKTRYGSSLRNSDHSSLFLQHLRNGLHKVKHLLSPKRTLSQNWWFRQTRCQGTICRTKINTLDHDTVTGALLTQEREIHGYFNPIYPPRKV